MLSQPTVEETKLFIDQIYGDRMKLGGMQHYSTKLASAAFIVGIFAERVPVTEDEVAEAQKVAMLYDILSNPNVTEEMLVKMGYSANTIASVKLLTKSEGQTRSQLVYTITTLNNLLAVLALAAVCSADTTYTMEERKWGIRNQVDMEAVVLGNGGYSMTLMKVLRNLTTSRQTPVTP